MQKSLSEASQWQIRGRASAIKDTMTSDVRRVINLERRAHTEHAVQNTRGEGFNLLASSSLDARRSRDEFIDREILCLSSGGSDAGSSAAFERIERIERIIAMSGKWRLAESLSRGRSRGMKRRRGFSIHFFSGFAFSLFFFPLFSPRFVIHLSCESRGTATPFLPLQPSRVKRNYAPAQAAASRRGGG